MDQKAWRHIDPANINDALDEIVRYQESLQSGQPQRDNSRKSFKSWATCVNDIPSSDGDLDSDEGHEPSQVAWANFKFSRQSWGIGQTSSAVQPPKPKESLNGSAPTSAPVDPVVQMKVS